MALFNKKTEKKTAEKAPAKVSKKTAASDKAAAPAKNLALANKEAFAVTNAYAVHPSAIIKAPRITEKGGLMAERGVYVFNVTPRAGKQEVAKAIKAIYGVVPEKVRLTKVPAKKILVRNKPGIKSGGKKAYVYLRKGEKIEII